MNTSFGNPTNACTVNGAVKVSVEAPDGGDQSATVTAADGNTYYISNVTIGSAEDWDVFAADLESGNSYAGVMVTLVNDIEVSAMAGTGSSHKFCGIFNGNHKKIVFNYTGTADYAAPFRYIEGATIMDLTVEGTISTGHKYAAGIVGQTAGTSGIKNCVSNVTINSSVDGDGTHGGFAGTVGGKLDFESCVFKGIINGKDTTKCGGFVGWNSGSITYTDCLQAGTISIRSGDGSDTFNRGTEGKYTRTYYVNDCGKIADAALKAYAEAPADDLTGEVSFWGEMSCFCACEVTGIREIYQSTGSSLTILPFVYSPRGLRLTKDTDYEVSFSPAEVKDAGIYTMTITGKSPYTGTKTMQFMVSDGVTYLDASGAEQKKQIGDDIVMLNEDDTVWEGSKWYIAGKDTEIGNRVTVQGIAYLVLCDGVTLNIPKGIGVDAGNTLVITGQSAGTGKLTIEGLTSEDYYAAIGGSNLQLQGVYGKCGTIIINGGDIRAVGGYGTGIGGGMYGNSGSITINNGTVYAKGGAKGWISQAGIGGGYGGNGNDNRIFIHGGRITAVAGESDKSYPATYAKGIGNGTSPKDDHIIHLGWRNRNDYIDTDSIGGKLTFDKAFVLDEDKTTVATAENCAGKKIIPAYKVTFDSMGGSAVDPVVVVASDKVKITAPDPAPANGDYTFGGWYTTSGLETPFDFGNTPVTGDMTLYAKWCSDSAHIVSFESNGGTAVPAQFIASGGICIAPDSSPTRTGYSFGGWYSDEGCRNAYNFSEAVSEDKTLYAKWTANTYQVVFDANTNDTIGGSMSPQSFTYDAGAVPLSVNTFTREGYFFAGWTVAADGTGTRYTDRERVQNLTEESNAQITLYAQWAPVEYKLTYDLAGGKNDEANPAKYYITTDTIMLVDPTHRSLPFKGWYDNPSLSGEPVTTIPKGSTGDKTLYACWGFSEDNVTVLFNGQEGSYYNGQAKNPTVKVSLGDAVLVEGTDYIVESYSPSEIKNAGKYTVTIIGIGNYKGSEAKKEFAILPKEVIPTVTTSGEILTYDGTPKIYDTVMAKDGDTIIDSSEYSVTWSDNINAGTNTASLTVTDAKTNEDTGNYTIAKQTVYFSIEKADLSMTVPVGLELIWDGTVKTLIRAGSATGGDFYYTVTTENIAPTDESLYIASIPTATDAETYYVWYKVVGDENHNDSTPEYVTAKITVDPKDREAVDLVTGRIDKLNDESDEKEVIYARIAYELLTDRQKLLVSEDSLSKLEATEAKIAAEQELEDAKATALAKVNIVDPEEYVTDDQNKVTAAKTTAEAAIKAATAIGDSENQAPGTVAKALVDFSTAINALKTQKEADAQALAEAKTTAKSELGNYKYDVVFADGDAYAAEVSRGKEVIDDASTVKGVKRALTDAKKAIDALKTKAEADAETESAAAAQLAAAKKAAKERLEDFYDAKNQTDYRAVQQKELADAREAGYQAIEEAATPAEAVEALAAAKEALNAVKTDAQLMKEEKEEADTKAALASTTLISELPASDSVKLADKAAIEAAAKTYDALSDDQKQKVDAATKKKLEDAQVALKKLEDAQVALKKLEDEQVALKKLEDALANAKKAASAAMSKPVKVKAKTKDIKISWTTCKEADGYDVYVQYAGKKFKKVTKNIKKSTTGKTKVLKIGGKKLNRKKDICVYVSAYKMIDGKKVVLANSKVTTLKAKRNSK
jgi:uncharacterized repeat protein (TIGR02543 family)